MRVGSVGGSVEVARALAAAASVSTIGLAVGRDEGVVAEPARVAARVADLAFGPALRARAARRASACCCGCTLERDGARRQEDDRRIDRLEVDRDLRRSSLRIRACGRSGASSLPVAAADGAARAACAPSARPSYASNAVPRRRSVRRGGGGSGRSATSKRSAIVGIAAEDADLAEVDAVGEADHAPRLRMVQEQEREADAREEDEERRGEEEDRDREEARRREEAAADDAPAAEDARHVDREAGAIARALAVVALDLAAQVARARARPARRRGSRGSRGRSESPPPSTVPATKWRSARTMICWSCAAPRRVARRMIWRSAANSTATSSAGRPASEAHALDDEERERADRREVAERGLASATPRARRARARGRRGRRAVVHGLTSTRCSRPRGRRAPRARRS